MSNFSENIMAKGTLACSLLMEYYEDVCPGRFEVLRLIGKTGKGHEYRITIGPVVEEKEG